MSIGILSVGAGDTKLTFDPSNPAEMIRSARIVKDMLRRGYALMVEVEGRYQRVTEFREDKCEYVIADFDPCEAAEADRNEGRSYVQAPSEGDTGSDETATAPAEANKQGPGRGNRSYQAGRGRTKAVSAVGAKGVAVARTAGG